MSFLSREKLEEFIYSFSLIPALVLTGQNLHSFFTSMFLHGSFGHLFGNMLFLNIFGDNLESRFGRMKYLIFYFFCGILASLSEIFLHPSSEIPMLGASGAIAGLMGGYLYLFPRHKIDVLFSFGFYFKVIGLPAWTMLVYWFFFQLLYGIGSLASPYLRGVAFFAHIGGFLAGLLFARFWKKKWL
jgi:membrane associated rhomboid family serine protease